MVDTPFLSSLAQLCVLSCFSHVRLCDAMDHSPSGSSVHGISQARILSGLPCPPTGDPPDPGIEPASPVAPALQEDPLPPEPPGSGELPYT